jgi:hypothetical protein
MALTRILFGASSLANAWVIVWTPAFDAKWTTEFGAEFTLAIVLKLMIIARAVKSKAGCVGREQRA